MFGSFPSEHGMQHLQQVNSNRTLPSNFENFPTQGIPSIETIFLDLDKLSPSTTLESQNSNEAHLSDLQDQLLKSTDPFELSKTSLHTSGNDIHNFLYFPNTKNQTASHNLDENLGIFSFSNQGNLQSQSNNPIFSCSSSLTSPLSSPEGCTRSKGCKDDSYGLEENGDIFKPDPMSEEAVIASMSHKEFTALLSASSPPEKARLRKIRRLIKNRKYAKTFRRKQQILSQTFTKLSAEKEGHIQQLQNALQRMKEERDFYKVKVEILTALGSHVEEPSHFCTCGGANFARLPLIP